MSYTGHKDPLINGQNIVEHLKQGVRLECSYYGIPMLTDEQIAVVASQLRMHTTLAHAVGYDFSELHNRDEVTTFYPEASSIGRFLRDSAQITLDEYRMKQQDSTSK